MRSRSPVVVAAAVAAAVAGIYVAFLGWDQAMDVDPVTGRLTGPYSTGQVIACGAAYLLVAVVGGIRSASVTALVAPVTFTLLWSVDAATDPLDQGLWPIGAVMVAVGTGIGAKLAATSGAALGGALRRLRSPGGTA